MKTVPTILYAGIEEWREGPTLTHFMPHPKGTQAYGSDPVYQVLVREPNAGETPTHWSWWDEEHQAFELTYPKKMLLEMCFTYGTKIEEEAGKGKVFHVVVERIKMLTSEEINSRTF